jgi:chromosome segregation ATPase
MLFDPLSSLRHPHFSIVQASRRRLIQKFKDVRLMRDVWFRIAGDRQKELSDKEAELAETLERLTKADAKIVSYSKKNTQLEVLLQSETQEKNAARREREAKETELAAALSANIALRADVRRLQMDVEISNDKIAILEHGARFYDTQNQVLQKSVESLLATMSGHEQHGTRKSDAAEQNAT